MTDRDTFAAAALTGLLTKDDAAKPESMAPWWPEWACSAAYRWADAMLRERERHHIPDAGKMTENTTNHDAVPEAKAYADGEPAPKCGGGAGLNHRDGTGNTPTLSESEREAIEQMLDEVSGRASAESWVPDILRNLLERLAVK
jgi:hypothetical protein